MDAEQDMSAMILQVRTKRPPVKDIVYVSGMGLNLGNKVELAEEGV